MRVRVHHAPAREARLPFLCLVGSELGFFDEVAELMKRRQSYSQIVNQSRSVQWFDESKTCTTMVPDRFHFGPCLLGDQIIFSRLYV